MAWDGSLEPFVPVDVGDVIGWLESVLPLDPSLLDAWSNRHVMITDPTWNGFRQATNNLVSDIMCRQFPGYGEQTRMLSVVLPGRKVEPHRDEQPHEWHVRIHVPLMTNENTLFYSAGVPHHMQVGMSYLVNTREEHAITNDGETPRIHFMFDVVTR